MGMHEETAMTESIDSGLATEAEWRSRLAPEEYAILRAQGTEPAFTGQYWRNHEKGAYHCAGCGAELFSSDTQFDSGTGRPWNCVPTPVRGRSAPRSSASAAAVTWATSSTTGRNRRVSASASTQRL